MPDMQAVRIRNFTSNLEESCHDMRTFWPDAAVSYSGKQPYYSNVNGLVLAHASFSDNATVPGLMISRLLFEDRHLISIPISGHSSHQFQGITYTAHPTQAVFQPAGVPINAWPATHVQTFQVTIDRSAYDRAVEAYVGHDSILKATKTFEIALKRDFGRNIAALSQRMVEWLNTPGMSLHESLPLLKILEQRFIQAVVEHQAQAWSFLDHVPVAEPYYVRMAEDYIRDNLPGGMDLATLSQVCGLSGRAIQLGFQKHRGLSPLKFSRNLRLDAARRDLINADVQLNVTQVAMKWGFSNLGRFAEDYSRRHQELPSETFAMKRDSSR